MEIVQKQNKILREIAKNIPTKELPNKKIKGLIKKMSEALAKKENGVALAGPQIGESLRIFIVDGNIWCGKLEEKDKKISPIVFINPIIKKMSKKQQVVNEGCLSVGGIFGTIKRAEKLTIEAFDENGKKFTRGVSNLLAQIVQHEIDHLNGVLFIDKAIHLEKTTKK